MKKKMTIFAWRDGKFEGPIRYYTESRRGKTCRGDLFDFDALRRFLDEAVVCSVLVFFLSSRRRHTRFDCDWSSDVCSSDLAQAPPSPPLLAGEGVGG